MRSLCVDALLCAVLVLVLVITRPHNWLLVALCAFMAALPDLFSVRHFLKELAGTPWKPNRYETFAKRIQWFERPIGGFVEVAWLAGTIVLLVPLLDKSL